MISEWVIAIKLENEQGTSPYIGQISTSSKYRLETPGIKRSKE